MGNANPPLEKGKITFINNHQPPLLDGEYVITVEQKLQNKNAAPSPAAAINEAYTNTKRFQVRGERFSIDSTEIESVFPPSNSQGEYENVLPHIVFSRKTLPWERTAHDQADSSWLALLLFDENDPIPEIQNIMVGDLQRSPFPHEEGGANQDSTLPGTAVSYLDISLEYSELMYDPCMAIDIPVSLFNNIVPGLVDLPWLTHARSVTPEQPARMGMAETDDISVESAVVVGNRLPEPNTKCTVHLVSLENMAPYLPSGDDYTPADIKLADGSAAEMVRLVSLKSWSYTSVDPKETFTGLLMDLDKEDGLRVFAINNPNPSDTEADSYVANGLKMGYTAMNHHTRQGCKTVSWYRGPFVPFEVPPTIFVPVPNGDPTDMPIQTADEAVRYNPETGMMDISYASAWQIGRLLALQDKGFSVALYNWKRSCTLATVMEFERQLLEQGVGETLGLTAKAHRDDPLVMHHAVAKFIKTRLKPYLIKEPPEDNDPPTGRQSPPAEMMPDITPTAFNTPQGNTFREGD
ncbi:hypothetical protein DO021_16565 [Desulfobacter hydrogenophilus]|uniref:Uncharacterized protein n=2 Tax=Desulfobacter hydrogenophilus TaxID=2291 RepID=A0A328FCW7_9BACT|nr:hypothetical protein [Desulfobacter hydrogenophilus]QBH14718.1 hypothetical protein EYB58_18420 [Desulfobacter hydrogenophilus]RAM00877.1 hypothetical protein DO021_16565 [Desulfobacter hydrogenophilus]